MRTTMTYRKRVVFSLGLIGLTMLLALLSAYLVSRHATLQQAQQNVSTLGHHIEDEINRGAKVLQNQIKMVRNHLGLRRQVYGVVMRNRDEWPLREFVRKRFSWLQDHQIILVARSSDVLVGEHQTQLVRELINRNKQLAPKDQLIYVQSDKGLSRMATASVYYGNRYLGLVAVAQSLDQAWMERISKLGGGDFVLVTDNKVLLSTLDKKTLGQSFSSQADGVKIAGQGYIAYQIKIGSIKNSSSQLWLLRSQNQALQAMANQNRVLLFSAITGTIVLFLIGLFILRGFQGPMKHIRDMVDDMKAGHMPSIKPHRSDQEFAYVERQFNKMAKSLQVKHSKLKSMDSEMRQQALTDSLTGLGNRPKLYDMYPQHLYEARRYNKSLTVILADIDGLRSINETYGHGVGDHVIMHLVAILRSCACGSDFLFRIGGGEFLILCTGETEGGLVLAEKIRAKLEHTPLKYEDQLLRITASFGVAQTNSLEQGNTLKALLARGHSALRAAKNSGHNRVAVANLEVVRA